MFNRVSELSKKPFANDASPSTGELDAGVLEPLLEDGETLKYLIASTDAIEYTTDERTTTFEPDDDCHAYVAVSNRQIYFLLEDDPTSPEIVLPLETVTSIEMRDGLLSSKLVTRTSYETIRFAPVDEESASAAASYASRIGSAWKDLFDALSEVRKALDEVENRLATGEDPRRAVQRARSRISNAHHCATHHDDAPTELMRTEIDPVEDQLDGLRVGSRLDSVEERLEEAREARADDAYETAFEAVVAADATLSAAVDATRDVDTSGVSDRFDDLEASLETVAGDLLADAESACHDALAADDPTEAVGAWQCALERYRAAISADWDGVVGVGLEALRFQLAWVVGNLITALADRASQREAAGDELGEDHDDAADHYEQARADLQRASRLAQEHPHASAGAFADRVETVEEKIERAQWQWGTAD